jgi:hypothetical protein
MEGLNKQTYTQALKDRGAKKNITQEFQLVGLEIATILHDIKSKSLYIKYAKELGSDRMISLAKDVAERRGINNPAAYFMTLVKELRSKDK